MKAAIDHEQSMDAVEVSEGGDFLKVDSEKIRTKFYNKLEMNGVKVSKIRQEVAVENMARVIKRIKMEYDMNAVDYFKIISHNQKEISMLWDVLLYMFGDLVEKDSGGGYTNKSSAKEIAKLSVPSNSTLTEQALHRLGRQDFPLISGKNESWKSRTNFFSPKNK